MSDQGNPFGGTSQTGGSADQGNLFQGGTSGRGTSTSAQEGAQSTNPVRQVEDRGPITNETEQGNPFSPNRANTTEDTGFQGGGFGNTGAGTSTASSAQNGSGTSGDSLVDIYVNELSLNGSNLVANRVNADALSVSLAPLIPTIDPNSEVTGLSVSNGMLTLTQSNADQPTITVNLDIPDEANPAARSAVLNGTDLEFYDTPTPGMTPLFTVDLASLVPASGENDYIASVTGAGTAQIVLGYNSGSSQTDLTVDMSAYLNSNVSQALNDLSDVSVPSPGDGTILTFSSADAEWQAVSPAQANHVSSGSVIHTGMGTDLNTVRLTLTDNSTVDVDLTALLAPISAELRQ